MKYIKMLGLAAVAASALMAFLGAGSASATVLCKTTTDPCTSKWPAGTTLTSSLESSAALKTSGGTTIATCTSGTTSGPLENEGSSTTTPTGWLVILTFDNCNTTVHVLAVGHLEIHKIAGTSNGTVTSTGSRVTINFLGVSCIFKTNATDIGTLTEGAPATFDISATIPEETGNFGCPSSGVWSGSYKFTEPATTLSVAGS